MENFISHNGEIFSVSAFRLPVSNRGFLLGDGVFTTMLLNNGVLANLDKHLARLKRDCFAIKIIFPILNENWIKDLVNANKAQTGTWRLKIIITGGQSKGSPMGERAAGDVIITLEKCSIELLNPFKLCIFPHPVVNPTAKIKSLAYLDRFFIKEYAVSNGFSDALTTTCEGIILEAAFSNIFWIAKDVLYTPSLSLPLLNGTVLETILEGAKKVRFPVKETHARIEEIPSHASIFLCNSISGVQPVDSIGSLNFSHNADLEIQIRSMNGGQA